MKAVCLRVNIVSRITTQIVYFKPIKIEMFFHIAYLKVPMFIRIDTI